MPTENPQAPPRLTSRQDIPGDGVCDSSEDPVQLSQGRSPVVQPPRNPAHGDKQKLVLLHPVFSRCMHPRASEAQPELT